MKNIIKKLFLRLGYKIKKIQKTDALKYLLSKKKHDDFFFVQIGANDGKRFDPIFKIVNDLGLSGLVIEPIKDYFEELTENYKNNKRVIPVNKAIYKENKKIPMYRVKKGLESLPKWTKGIASIDAKHYEKSNTKKEYIIEEIVEAITFETLFQTYNIKNIDFLQIDAEGYDYHLLKMFPFEQFKPAVIVFEHQVHNIMTQEQLFEICFMLSKMGYNIEIKASDTLAYL